MATPQDSAAWLARGRTHQWEGRPIDAIPCFERAARLDPASSDASFHLGEVQWQIGMAREAIAAWQEAVRRTPNHPAARLALAEALLFVDDETGALAEAEAMLAIAPGEHRALAVRAVTRPVEPDTRYDLAEAATLAARDSAPFAARPLARSLARRWTADARGDDALLAALAPHVHALPWPAVAALAASALRVGNAGALDAALRVARDRDVPAEDLDALRSLAATARAAGRTEESRSLALRYAEHALHAFAPPFPLLWPRRAEGERLRVAVVAGRESGEALRTLDTVLSPQAATVDVVLWWLGEAAAKDAPTIARATVRRWPGAIDAAFAKAVAADDPDLLVDALGLAQPSGALFGAVPARRYLSVAAAPLPIGPAVDADDAASVRAAVDGIRQAIASLPRCRLDARALRELWEAAVGAHRSGDAEAALAAYDAFLVEQPDYAPALHLRATLLREAGERETAAEALGHAVACAPDYRDARLAAMRLAGSMRDPGRLRALASEGESRATHPDPVLLRVLGEAELALGDYVRGGEALRRALALAPADPDTHYNLGVAAQMRRDVAEAARAYQRALVLDPAHVPSHFNMAVLLEERGQLAAARSAYGNVLRLDPRRATAYKNLGEILARDGDLAGLDANFRRFEAACPESMLLAVHALETCQFRGDFAALERYLEGLRHERFKAADEVELVDCMEQLLYLTLYFDVEPEMMLRLAGVYDAAARKVYGEPLPRPDVRRPGRVRVGYLSGDLRDHVMGKQVWQALQHHDRDRFELHFFSTSPVRDAWTARFEGLAHAFVEVHAMGEREAAQRIAQADLDVLVDLSTHTKGAKPGILAFKPARVQITHVASAGTVGLSTVDFKLTDRYADLPSMAEWQLEAFLPMEGCVYPYRAVEPAAEHPFHRASLGIPAGDVVIGAFVQPLKLSRRCLTLWREVLARIPRARLAFSPLHPALRDAIVRLAGAAGIDRSRLLFLPQGRDDAENLARYALVDFVLDTMPYGGVNGVIEPLAAGIPVVTLLGRRHGERSAYTILANLGVTDTVAQTGGEYVEIAHRLATDRAFVADLRERIRAGLVSSPLVDMPAHARHLEAAYLRALAERAPEALAAAEASR